MHNDSLYRVSLKCLIRNDDGDLLLVKEAGRDFWDLPGGGMDHGENIDAAIARELLEEVGYLGDFTYKVVGLDEPIQLLSREVWQLRIILDVTPKEMNFSVGIDADEIQFMKPAVFKNAEQVQERKIYEYAELS
ncbi:MAG TPA: NUDIX hydrolase [Candidatus Saccharimonadales bacterium]